MYNILMSFVDLVLYAFQTCGAAQRAKQNAAR